jgi:hypothetical protein
MHNNRNLYSLILPQGTPPHHAALITTLDGLLDVLIVLEAQLVQCPGAIPVLANTLREMLLEVVVDGS